MGKGAGKSTRRRIIIAPFLLHLKCEGDRSIHQVSYGYQSQFRLRWEDKQISRPQEEKVGTEHVQLSSIKTNTGLVIDYDY